VSIELVAVTGIGEIKAGDVLSEVLVGAAPDLRTGDVLVVTHKIVSKAEGRIVRIDPDDPRSLRRAAEQESVRVVRRRGDRVVAETAHGFVCADAGVDVSNVEPGWAALLPADPDRSARKIRDGVRARASAQVGVIVSDRFERPWRRGRTGVAIGCAGIAGLVIDRDVCVVDELAAAAELVMATTERVPAVVVRGVDPAWLREGSVHDEVVSSPADDLFR
jgi:coenzyme F420-0:L-glutamate ligase/coenzyme F420-1:gamma-L-glutamate ligase